MVNIPPDHAVARIEPTTDKGLFDYMYILCMYMYYTGIDDFLSISVRMFV